jgi:O-antigen/teichoic acid export membrane protein
MLARDVGVLWTAEGIALALGLVQTVVVARFLGPREFGTAALILGFSSMVFNVLDPKSQEAVVKYVQTYRASGLTQRALAVPRVAYGADLLLGVAGVTAVAALAPWARDHLVRADSGARLLVLLAIASAFSSPIATSRAILTTFGRFSTVAVLQAASAMLRTVLAILLVSTGHGVRGPIYAVAITVVVESMATGAIAYQTMRSELGGSWWSARRANLGADFREMVQFMFYTDLTSLVGVLTKEADLFVLGLVRGPLEGGYYRLARSVAAPIASVILPLQQAVYPRISAMVGTGDAVGLQKARKRYTLQIGTPVGLVVALGLLVLPVVVPMLAGPDYRRAVLPATILYAGSLVVLPVFWIRPSLLAGGHVRFLLLTSIVTGVLTGGGYFVLGDRYGAVGVASARALFAGLVGTIIALTYCLRQDRPARTDVPKSSFRVNQ